MLCWVIYDISDTNSRSKIAAKCKDYGLVRVQKSAFLGDLTKNKFEMLAEEIGSLAKESDDCIFMIPNCRQCFLDKIIKGKFDVEAIENKDFLIIA